MIVLDTHVIAEPLRARPSAAVLAWLNAQAPDSLFTTTLNLAELYAGIAVLRSGKRPSELQGAVRATIGRLFGGRVLEFDVAAAESYAVIAERARSSGQAVPHDDALIASIAMAHGFAVASRNAGHFDGAGIMVINPWGSEEDGGDRMNELRIREIVANEIGESYVLVIASGIARYLSDTDRWSAANERDVAALSVKARRLFDAHEEIFLGRTRMPIGARREIVSRFLRGEDVRPLLVP
ncbi:type II toxin-antitoxin system VapC family toxin [Solimonas sp. SE-A11]|uniref:type II toxin-antitoxin system VapC family toxin n=1 Tax=Solimonas sp. SE-A11 TaxID=3054954 RepID=UPI00259CE3C0|nr:type II toxin-antitoxin system VapC family toxin [Solimonas sp. SE-A11]